MAKETKSGKNPAAVALGRLGGLKGGPALAAGCPYIVTHNVKDFHGAEQLGVTALSPREYLSLIRKKS
jgi:hypothetical protein